MDIIKLFTDRDNAFYNETNEILDALAPIIDGVTDFIDDTYSMDASRELVWEGVNLFDGIVNFVGVISYDPGTTMVSDDGHTVAITEDNQEYFQQMMRIGVPLDIVLSQSSNVTYTYLVNLQKAEEAQAQEESVSELESHASDFDLSTLSDGQRSQLALTPSGTGVLN